MTTRRAVAVLVACAGAAAASQACGVPWRPKHAPVDPVAAEWARTLVDARAALADGRAAHADSALTAFREQFGSTPEGTEALFWRALARADGAAPNGSSRAAVADLDAYRAAPAAEHRAEAGVLRRALALLDSARSAAPVSAPAERAPTPARTAPPGFVSRDSLRARDDTIQHLRADVKDIQSELDRIRRRLAAPARRP